MKTEIWNHFKHFCNCSKTKESALLAIEEQSKCSGPWIHLRDICILYHLDGCSSTSLTTLIILDRKGLVLCLNFPKRKLPWIFNLELLYYIKIWALKVIHLILLWCWLKYCVFLSLIRLVKLQDDLHRSVFTYSSSQWIHIKQIV